MPESDLNNIGTQLVAIANKIADRAVKNHCLNCGVSEIVDWAKRWLSGYNRDSSAYATYDTAADIVAATRAARAAYNTADTAYVAAYNAAYVAAYAVDAAAYAADAVHTAAADDAAAVRVELKLQADDIRSEIPEWIWS